MGAQKVRPTELSERFLEYLHEERADLLLEIRKGDAKAVEDRKRLRRLEREINTIKGGPL